MDFIPSSAQTIGPFFHVYFDQKTTAGPMVRQGAKGERIRIACRVLDGQEAPVSDALVELWQADSAGIYDHPNDTHRSEADSAVLGFARLPTNDEGACQIETVKPGRVSAEDGAAQAPHINAVIFGRGILKGLRTRIYFAGDPANQEDPVLALVPPERRDTLMAHQDPREHDLWRIDFRLCGDAETVFFDV